MDVLIEKIKQNIIPSHVALIMDGNGRWAKNHNKERVYGHQQGALRVKEVAKAAVKVGVKYVTFYAFSKENWRRPEEEVNFLMDLLVEFLEKEQEELYRNGIRLLVIGDMETLPEHVRTAIEGVIYRTRNNKKLNLIIALNYGARWEIANAAKNIAKDVVAGKVKIDEIEEDMVANYMTTAKIPDPELMIRTSGEKRISNFLLWQLAYSELYFTDKYWPEFGEEDFYKAILDFQKRERRFGKISEQLKEEKK